MKMIATFYSHFGATRFMKKCKDCGYQAKLMPVPRSLSSSCGTCVEYISKNEYPFNDYSEEIEQVVKVLPEGYELYYKAENS